MELGIECQALVAPSPLKRNPNPKLQISTTFAMKSFTKRIL